tara:strand:+ start:2540 stop:2686 length:147 start_codon:yes stop_codon:yes gene_type:complete
MIKKILEIEVVCENEKVWGSTLKEIKELIEMLQTIQRTALITKIKDVE